MGRGATVVIRSGKTPWRAGLAAERSWGGSVWVWECLGYSSFINAQSSDLSRSTCVLSNFGGSRARLYGCGKRRKDLGKAEQNSDKLIGVGVLPERRVIS